MATTRLSADFDRGCGEFTAGGARLTTLALFSLFTVFNARSDERSACIGLLSNKWLWASVGFPLLLLTTVMGAGEPPGGWLNAYPHLIGGTRCSASPPSPPCTFNIVSLILSMAREGDRPFGHTSVQFMIVRQRNSR
jgi:hypothetical protein